MIEDPQKIAKEYFEVKEQMNKLEKRRKKLKESLFNVFDSKNTNKIYVDDIKVFRRNIERIKWNEPILRSILKPKGLWTKVLSVDNTKVKKLVQSGLVLESEVAEAKIINETWYTYAKKVTPQEKVKTGKESSRLKPVIITDLSRMKNDKVCIFGVDESGSPVRPVMPGGIRESQLSDETGQLIVKPGAEVQFELVKRIPKPPHTEDFLINGNYGPVLVRNLSEQEMEDVLELTLYDCVEDIFACNIQNNRFISEGEGKRSLGTIKVENILFVRYGQKDNGKKEYRIEFMDKSGVTYNLPVTDCAFRNYCDRLSFRYPTFNVVAWHVKQELDRKTAFLRVGLTRTFRGVHWLQISGVYTFPDYKNG